VTARTLGNREFYGAGPWAAFNSPWGSDGVDFDNLTNIDTATFPNGTVLNWQYPRAARPNGQPYGYDFVTHGQYDNGLPGLPVGSIKLANAKAITLDYALSYWNQLSQWNGLGETYFRDTAGNKKLEVGFFTHVPAATANWIATDNRNPKRSLGIYTDPKGVKWTAVLQDGGSSPYVTLSPPDGRDRPAGAIDFLAAARWLQGKGVVDPAWYYSGLALGAEPLSGGGWLRITSMSVDAR
jgi:hypothetical protein